MDAWTLRTWTKQIIEETHTLRTLDPGIPHWKVGWAKQFYNDPFKAPSRNTACSSHSPATTRWKWDGLRSARIILKSCSHHAGNGRITLKSWLAHAPNFWHSTFQRAVALTPTEIVCVPATFQQVCLPNFDYRFCVWCAQWIRDRWKKCLDMLFRGNANSSPASKGYGNMAGSSNVHMKSTNFTCCCWVHRNFYDWIISRILPAQVHCRGFSARASC